MQTVLFLRNKIGRQIASNGQEFTFVRNDVDEYKQQLDSLHEIASISGIFHEAVSYIKKTDSDGGQIVSKTQPMILTLCDEHSSLLTKGDKVSVGDVVYVLVEKHNIKNLDVAYDISLEVSV